jgi:hypothetical protein
MLTCHLFVTVNNDGLGDFSHFVDIYNAIRKDRSLRHIQYIPVVYVRGENQVKYVTIQKKLRSMSIPFYYLFGNFPETNDSLQKKIYTKHGFLHSLQKTDQIILISFDDGIFSVCRPYINSKAIIKTINEHEGCKMLKDFFHLRRGLGLEKGGYGIKIADITPLSLPQAGELIERNDMRFYSDLMHHTNATDFLDFCEKNVCIPAYFNDSDVFFRFLSFLTTHEQSKKDLAIYFSGCDLTSPLVKERIDALLKRVPNTPKIELITKNGEKKIVFNTLGEGRTIRIFMGYFISDNAYSALFSIAKIAGVSGDNTLEFSIAHRVLPYYRSTNFFQKQPTLKVLKKISQLPELSMSIEARVSFNIYFDLDAIHFEHIVFAGLGAEDTNPFNRINLPAMIEAWPTVANYLKKSHNFYHHLKDIVLEKLPDNKPITAMMEFQAALELAHKKKSHKQMLAALINVWIEFNRLENQQEASVAIAAKHFTQIALQLASRTLTEDFFYKHINAIRNELIAKDISSHHIQTAMKMIIDVGCLVGVAVGYGAAAAPGALIGAAVGSNMVRVILPTFFVKTQPKIDSVLDLVQDAFCKEPNRNCDFFK